jgi:tetratricopeptide (TPR) repeat protein
MHWRTAVIRLLLLTILNETVTTGQGEETPALPLDPRQVEEAMRVGNEQLESGDLDTAIQNFWNAMKAGEAAAVSKYEQAYILKGLPAAPFANIAKEYLKNGALDPAAAIIEKAMKLLNDDSDPFERRAVLNTAHKIMDALRNRRPLSIDELKKQSLASMCRGLSAADFPEECSAETEKRKAPSDDAKSTSSVEIAPKDAEVKVAVRKRGDFAANLDDSDEAVTPPSTDKGDSAGGVRPRRVYYYLHFHKAAGSTVCELARANRLRVNHYGNCNDEKSRRCCGDTLTEQTEFAQRTKLDFVANEGSMPEGPMDLDSFDFFTCLRHPISRAVSHFYHARDSRPQQLGDISIEDWVLNLPDNFYVRHMNGPTALNLPRGAVDNSHLLHAMSRLKQFRGVMIMEWLDNNQQQLATWFNWTTVDPSGRHRRGTNRESTSRDLPGAADSAGPLFPLFQLDLVLYRFAQLLNMGRTAAAAELYAIVGASSAAKGGALHLPAATRQCGAEFCCGACLWADF